MSNLVKQYYVTNDNTPVRVINSSKKFEEKLKALEEQQKEKSIKTEDPLENYEELLSVDEEEGEFVQGLDALQVETEESLMAAQQLENSEAAERIVEEAREEAEKIIEEAKAAALLIMEDANTKAENLYSENKEKGYQDGLDQANLDIEAQRESLEADIEIRRSQLDAEIAKRSEEMESDIVEAMIQVFNKVFHIQFDNKKELLMHLIRNTLMNVEVGREFRIHVSENNFKFINSHLDDVRDRVGNDVEIEVVNDAALDSSDCQIETSFGVFDCGIDMELSNLVKDIRSLCS